MLVDTSMDLKSTADEQGNDITYEEKMYSCIITKLNVDASMSLQEFVCLEEHEQEADIHDIENDEETEQTEPTESADTYEENLGGIIEIAIPVTIHEALQGIHHYRVIWNNPVLALLTLELPELCNTYFYQDQSK